MAAAHAGGREEEEGSDALGELKSQKDLCRSCCLVRMVRVEPREQSREVGGLKCV